MSLLSFTIDNNLSSILVLSLSLSPLDCPKIVSISGLYFFIFDTVMSKSSLPMTRFKLRISGVGGICSTNLATIIAQSLSLIVCLCGRSHYFLNFITDLSLSLSLSLNVYLPLTLSLNLELATNQ